MTKNTYHFILIFLGILSSFYYIGCCFVSFDWNYCIRGVIALACTVYLTIEYMDWA